MEDLPNSNLLKILSYVLPTLLFGCIGVYAVTGIWGPLFIAASVQLGFLMTLRKPLAKRSLLISGPDRILHRFRNLIETFERFEFEDARLKELQEQLRDENARLQVAAAMADDVERVSNRAEAQERIRSAERRLTEIDNELISLNSELIDHAEVAKVLANFESLWQALLPREQDGVLELLVERVECDGKYGNVSLTFHPCSIKSLTEELANQQEDAA